MFNIFGSFRTQTPASPQLELDKQRLAHASNAAMQLHFDRMQTALDAHK